MGKITKPETITFKLTGVAPLVMHSGRLANPLDPATKAVKAVSSKRKKADEDIEELARLEWIGSLYAEDNVVGIPSDNIEAMVAEASKAQKMGKQFKAGVFCDGFFPLEYDGPKDFEKLWNGGEHRLTVQARVMASRVMRTRPIFKKWSLVCQVAFFPQVVNREAVIEAMEHAGVFVGLGDWRPRYGRFEVDVVR
jgi:hypothetical protein